MWLYIDYTIIYSIKNFCVCLYNNIYANNIQTESLLFPRICGYILTQQFFYILRLSWFRNIIKCSIHCMSGTGEESHRAHCTILSLDSGQTSFFPSSLKPTFFFNFASLFFGKINSDTAFLFNAILKNIFWFKNCSQIFLKIYFFYLIDRQNCDLRQVIVNV